MENFIDAIRSAVADDASNETRANGAQACRTILAALEARLGDSLAHVAPIAQMPAAPALQAIVGALRTMPGDQLLDVAIAKLRTLVPAGTEVSVQSVRIPLLPIDALRGQS